MRAIPQIQNPAIKQWCDAVLKVPSLRPNMPSAAEQEEFREFVADYPDLHCYDFQALTWAYLLKHSLTLTPQTERRLLTDPEMQPLIELIRQQKRLQRIIDENPEIRTERDWVQFLTNHPDISACTANRKLIEDWIRGIPDTVNAESLERAYNDPSLKASLAKAEPPKPKQEQEQELPKTVAVTPTATPTASVTCATPRLTKKEISSWSGETMRQKMKDPAVRQAMKELGISFVKER